jgi:SOS response regulatory protein OraA/RecX
VQKGVARPLIDLVLQELSPASSETDTAADAAGRYWNRISRSRAATDPLVAKKKLFDHLMRRGFNYETSKAAIAHLLRDRDE